MTSMISALRCGKAVSEFADALHGPAGDVVGEECARVVGIDDRVDEPLGPFLDHAVLGIGAHAVAHQASMPVCMTM